MSPTLRSILDIELSRRDRLIAYYFAGLALLVSFYTITYNVGSSLSRFSPGRR